MGFALCVNKEAKNRNSECPVCIRLLQICMCMCNSVFCVTAFRVVLCMYICDRHRHDSATVRKTPRVASILHRQSALTQP